ncbi:MAG: GspE/PulE family protein [Patescibacteria group bacterium]|jgi:type IV pilus assembly protein PilB
MPAPQAITSVSTSIGDILISQGLITKEQLAEAEQKAQQDGSSVEQHLAELPGMREDEVVRAKGQLYNVPYADLFGRIVRAEILNLIPQNIANTYHMVTFAREANEVSLAMLNPSDFKALEAIEFIARKNRLTVKYHITTKASLGYILRQYESLSAEVEEALKGAEEEATERQEALVASDDKSFEEVVRQAPVSKMVSVIMRHAVEGGASDVHIEPLEEETRVRFRVDGMLHTSIVLPPNVHNSLVARIKVLSRLKIDETRVPQDGRFRMNIDGKDIDYRVSTLPLMNNEKVVMRILDTSNRMTMLSDLGFEGKNLEKMEANSLKSHGMFLITGPTGSGKSTTLYALMSRLNKDEVNIITLEDPVEYYMHGINQSQVNPEVGLTFAAGLRSILRQDPDIIMVGEIRDNETAELAVHAALTGHIMLSTLHTNDAFGAVPRLIDMDIEPFLITSSLNLVMAQRLVRRVCQHCTEERTIAEGLEKAVRDELKNVDPKEIPRSLAGELKFMYGRGCPRCENTGYKGRVAIAEVLEMSDELKRIIVDAKQDLIGLIQAEFKRQKMLTIKQDGMVKVLHGSTTIEEVLNATRS